MRPIGAQRLTDLCPSVRRLPLGFLQYVADNNGRLGDDGKDPPHACRFQMSEEQLKTFLEAVKADAGHQEKPKKDQSTMSEEELKDISGGSASLIDGLRRGAGDNF